MEFLITYGKEIFSLFVPFISWLLNAFFRAKARLIWGSSHAFSFLVPEPLRDASGNIIRASQAVNTASITVQNVGRDTANKVELVFNWKPQFLNLWPVRRYEQSTAEDGRHTIIFENLAPKERLGLEIMSVNSGLPELLVVRCAECVANRVPLVWVKQDPLWKRRVSVLLAFIGIGATVYAGVSLIQVLVLKTPMAG